MKVAVARPRTTLSAQIIHADGTVTDLGIISKDGRPIGAIKRFLERMKRHGK